MSITPELVAIFIQSLTFLALMVSGYVKIERRLTTVEVKIDVMRREENAHKSKH